MIDEEDIRKIARFLRKKNFEGAYKIIQDEYENQEDDPQIVAQRKEKLE